MLRLIKYPRMRWNWKEARRKEVSAEAAEKLVAIEVCRGASRRVLRVRRGAFVVGEAGGYQLQTRTARDCLMATRRVQPVGSTSGAGAHNVRAGTTVAVPGARNGCRRRATFETGTLGSLSTIRWPLAV